MFIHRGIITSTLLTMSWLIIALKFIFLITEQMIESRFDKLMDHSLLNLKKKWLFGILDDFITKQLPHNVTWSLSLLYALDHQGDRAMTSTQGS